MNMREVARIVYRLMDDKDKEDFSAKDVTLQDENGEKKNIRMGGVKLLFAQITGYAEKMEVYRCLLETIGISRPLQDELMTEAEAEERQKKSLILPQTGGLSSTLSQVNTDGHSIRSGDSP